MADPAFMSSSVVGIADDAGTTFLALPVTDFRAEATSNPQIIDTFDATRQKSLVVPGQSTVAINFSGPLTYEDGMQLLLKKAVGGDAWAAGVLLPSETNNKAAVTFDMNIKLDQATPDYMALGDCIVSQLSISAPDQGVVTYDAQIIGTTLAVTTTGPTAHTPLAGLSPFMVTPAGSTATVAGATGITQGFIGATINITNGTNSKYAWGSPLPDHVTLGNLNVAGDLEAYYRADGFFDAFSAGTLAAITMTWKNQEATNNTLTITMTKSSLTGVGLGNSDTTWTTNISFGTQYDATNKKIKFAVSTV